MSVELTVIVVAVSASASGCGHLTSKEKIGRDTYRIACALPLEDCLREAANNACAQGPYFVLRAVNDRNFRGRTDVPKADPSSEVVLRCGPAQGLGKEAKAFMADATAGSVANAGAPAAPSLAASVCAPGATQACVGPGQCAGGQACRADGGGFLPCDCGSSAITGAAPASSPAAPPSVSPAPRAPP